MLLKSKVCGNIMIRAKTAAVVRNTADRLRKKVAT